MSFVCFARAFAAEPTTGPPAGTTAAHNLVRQNLNNGVAPVASAAVQPVPCPPLPAFVWDDTIALTAQSWANQCTCAHELGSPYGENIAWAHGDTGTAIVQGDLFGQWKFASPVPRDSSAVPLTDQLSSLRLAMR